MKNDFDLEVSELADCREPLCPLNRVQAGAAVRIRRLCAPPEVADRLRELGFCENQTVKLLTAQSSIICMVCNARLALNVRMAETILVEPLRAVVQGS